MLLPSHPLPGWWLPGPVHSWCHRNDNQGWQCWAVKGQTGALVLADNPLPSAQPLRGSGSTARPEVALLGMLRHWVTSGSGKQAAIGLLQSFIASVELIRHLAAIKRGFVAESHLPNNVFSIGHRFPLGIFLPICKGWRCWGCL